MDGVDRGKESVPLHEPGLEVRVHVQDEDEVFCFEITADGRVVAAACAEDGFAGEVDDVAPAWVVAPAEVFAKRARSEVPEYGDFVLMVGARDFAQLVEAARARSAGARVTDDWIAAWETRGGPMRPVNTPITRASTTAPKVTNAVLFLRLTTARGVDMDRECPSGGGLRR